MCSRQKLKASFSRSWILSSWARSSAWARRNIFLKFSAPLGRIDLEGPSNHFPQAQSLFRLDDYLITAFQHEVAAIEIIDRPRLLKPYTDYF